MVVISLEINIFNNLAQLAPGFIGVAVGKLMTGDNTKEPLNNGILKYFLYSGSSWCICTLFNLVCTMSDSIFLVMSIFVAALLGILWPTLIKGWTITAANFINKLFNKNPIFLNESILEKLTADNEPHFLEVYKGGKVITSGWGSDVMIHENAFIIDRDLEWEEYFKNHEHEERTVIFLDKDTYIKEYKLKEETTEIVFTL